MPLEQARAYDPNLAALSEWLTTEGFRADIPALRALYPGLQAFAWLRRNGWDRPAQ